MDGAFNDRAARINGSMGIAQGFPNNWHYLEVPRSKLYATKENIEIMAPPSAGIQQNGYRDPMVGYHNTDMVVDTPFDYKGQRDILYRTGMIGGLTIFAGSFLL